MVNFRDEVKNQMQLTSNIMTSFPWEKKEAYAMWLAQTFYMVNHSTRLVALAGAYAPLDRGFLHDRFVDHSKEERGHQLVCLSDLKAIGHSIDQIPCLHPSATMYQIQYYWIQFRGAVSFFGYTLALEALAEHFGPEIYRRVCDAHGKNAAKFLKLHSEADIGHLEEAFKGLEKLNNYEAELVLENLNLSSDIYREMLVKSQDYSKKLATANAA